MGVKTGIIYGKPNLHLPLPAERGDTTNGSWWEDKVRRGLVSFQELLHHTDYCDDSRNRKAEWE